MLVLKSTHRNLKERYDKLKTHLENAEKWAAKCFTAYTNAHNHATSAIKTAQELLDENSTLRTQLVILASERRQDQFSQEELNTLITLCHPDKHAGSKRANEITSKLLSMRK